MKNILIFIFSLFVISISAQDRTITKTMPQGATYYDFTFSAADTLTSNQDTIDVIISYRADGYVKKLVVGTRMDTIAGADTTVNTSVFGKELYNDSTYVQIIAASTSGLIWSANKMQILTSDWTETVTQANSSIAGYNTTVPATDIPFTNPAAGTADTLEVPQIIVANAAQTITNGTQTNTPLDKTYRFYRIRYIYNGPDYTGGGIKLDYFEIKFYID